MARRLAALIPVSRKHLVAAGAAAFALRLFFILRFPATADDALIYDGIARNWISHGVYGLTLAGRLTPVMLRMPGYPAFLAAVHLLFGYSAGAVMLVQAAIDVLTCCLIAALAARLLQSPKSTDRASCAAVRPAEAATIALWLAALCPFTANYAAVLLTEPLTLFFSTLALLVLLEAFKRSAAGQPAARFWLLGGALTGLATLIRPETPLLLAGIGLALVIFWRRPAHWARIARAAAWMALGLLLPLLPWAARNWHTFHTVQFLAPRYTTLPDEFIPLGFFQWTHTWLTRFPDVNNTLWKLGDDAIQTENLPAEAFDSPAEQRRVAELLAQYNRDNVMTPELDREFARLDHVVLAAYRAAALLRADFPHRR
jgi:4-amino-4-deoxy-L-arabinose transferase-like glycosyltransferase